MSQRRGELSQSRSLRRYQWPLWMLLDSVVMLSMLLVLHWQVRTLLKQATSVLVLRTLAAQESSLFLPLLTPFFTLNRAC